MPVGVDLRLIWHRYADDLGEARRRRWSVQRVEGEAGATVHIATEDADAACEVPCEVDLPEGKQFLIMRFGGVHFRPQTLTLATALAPLVGIAAMQDHGFPAMFLIGAGCLLVSAVLFPFLRAAEIPRAKKPFRLRCWPVWTLSHSATTSPTRAGLPAARLAPAR